MKNQYLLLLLVSVFLSACGSTETAKLSDVPAAETVQNEVHREDLHKELDAAREKAEKRRQNLGM